MSISKFLLFNLKEETYGYIYKIINQINNKRYIGQTTKENKCRWDGTLTGAGIYNKHFQNSVNKYGVENFKIEIIDIAKDEKELSEKEIYWIAFYKSYDLNYGYNKTYGGEGGKPTKEMIEKRKKSWTPERRKEQAKRMKELAVKLLTPERRRSLSERWKGEKNPNYDKHLSKETKKKISIKMSGENSPHWKGNDAKNLSINTIHKRIEKIKPKPTDGKCKICDKVVDKEKITKLILSNIKEHNYTLNPDDYQWVHKSCHKVYDWTPERKKEFSDKMSEITKGRKWSPERKKALSERNRKNNPMHRPEVVEKWRESMKKNKVNKSKNQEN